MKAISIALIVSTLLSGCSGGYAGDASSPGSDSGLSTDTNSLSPNAQDFDNYSGSNGWFCIEDSYCSIEASNDFIEGAEQSRWAGMTLYCPDYRLAFSEMVLSEGEDLLNIQWPDSGTLTYSIDQQPTRESSYKVGVAGFTTIFPDDLHTADLLSSGADKLQLWVEDSGGELRKLFFDFPESLPDALLDLNCG
jgi:hypothetical protein